jgi:hypothetical protein
MLLPCSPVSSRSTKIPCPPSVNRLAPSRHAVSRRAGFARRTKPVVSAGFADWRRVQATRGVWLNLGRAPLAAASVIWPLTLRPSASLSISRARPGHLPPRRRDTCPPSQNLTGFGNLAGLRARPSRPSRAAAPMPNPCRKRVACSCLPESQSFGRCAALTVSFESQLTFFSLTLPST